MGNLSGHSVSDGRLFYRQPGPRDSVIIGALLLLYITVYQFLQTSWLDSQQSLSDILKATPDPSPFGLGSTKLDWISCGDRFQCANLSLPLDHLKPEDDRRAYIAITRYLGSNRTDSTGTMIFNPGGPISLTAAEGGSGTASTYRIGPLLDKILQGRYDVLGFDPRGINLTLPRVNCVRDTASRAGLGQLTSATAPNLHPHDIGMWDAVSQIIAEECEWYSGEDVLPYVNTPSVARDIAAIIDALHAEKRHHVSYWGLSYGTNLGAIFAAMFPNKLHKIILDGIRSPFDARDIFEWGYTSLASQTDTMEGFFKICDEVGPERCIIAGNSRKTVMDLLDSLYDRPLPVITDSQFGLVTYYNYKNMLYGTLYRPKDWARFAEVTNQLLLGNGTLALPEENWSTIEATAAVLCTDAIGSTKYSLAEWSEFVRNMSALSYVAGDSRSLETLPCRHWYTTPSERWEGSFDEVELETPVLLLSNSFDPATPLESAQRLHKAMGKGNSRLLEQASYGHCSISTVSTCTWMVVLDYLLTGALPQHGKVCHVDDQSEAYFPAHLTTSQENLLEQFSDLITGPVHLDKYARV